MIVIAQIVVIVVSIFIILFVIELVRRKRMKEKPAFLWLSAGIFSLGVGIFLNTYGDIIRTLGVVDPGIFTLFLGFSFLFVVTLYQSVQISKMSDDVKTLIQRIGILQTELSETRGSGKHTRLELEE